MTEQIVSAVAPVPNISGLSADRTGDEAATGTDEPYDWIDRARSADKDAFGRRWTVAVAIENKEDVTLFSDLSRAG